MKKTVKSYLLCSVVIFALTTVSASAFYSHSGLTESPIFDLDVTAYSFVYNLKSSYNTVKVGHVGTIFTSGALPSGMVQQPHNFPIYLVDEDYGNDDDYLKRYEGAFENGNLVYVTFEASHWPDYEPVDTEGDNQAELYIEGTLTSDLSLGGKDTSSCAGESMFYFDIQVD